MLRLGSLVPKINSLRYYSSGSEISRVLVIGAGLMGSGITQTVANGNLKVTMLDQSSSQLERGQGIIRGSLARIAKKKFPDEADKQSKFVDSVFANVSTADNLSTALKTDFDLVIEAVNENLELKQKLFAQLDKETKPSAILCTNTSSLPVDQISRDVGIKGRVAGLHFFNPVPQMKLVEVVKCNFTEDKVHQNLLDLFKKLGKVPITCKDSPGFIVNRLLVPYMLEAVRIYERGDATIEDIDLGMKLGAGYPMGPFQLMDFVGLDTMNAITQQWYDSNPKLQGNALVKPSTTIQKLVKEGKLGNKSGEGFYKYDKK